MDGRLGGQELMRVSLIMPEMNPWIRDTTSQLGPEGTKVRGGCDPGGRPAV